MRGKKRDWRGGTERTGVSGELHTKTHKHTPNDMGSAFISAVACLQIDQGDFTLWGK